MMMPVGRSTCPQLCSCDQISTPYLGMYTVVSDDESCSGSRSRSGGGWAAPKQAAEAESASAGRKGRLVKLVNNLNLINTGPER